MTGHLKLAFMQTRDHWLFWPVTFLVLQIFFYIFFFSENGYLAYQNRMLEKQKVEAAIASLENQKKSLEKRLKLIKDENIAVKEFNLEFLQFREEVSILKFLENTDIEKTQKETGADLSKSRRWYLGLSSAVLLLVIVLAFKFRTVDKYEELETHH